MNVVGAPKRIVFTLPAADVVGSTAVYIAVQPPTGTAFDVLAVFESVADGINTYHADISAAQTTAGSIGIWRVMPKVTGADIAVYPKYDDAVTLDFELQWDTSFNTDALITPTKLREHITTELSDLALQAIIDAEEAALNDAVGSLGTQIEEFDDCTPGDLIFPARTISTITSIVEKWPDTFIGGYTSTTLDTTDYEIVPGNKSIRRLGSGTHSATRWGRRVVVTYTPSAETAKRVLALINLCKLNIAYTGLKSESIGGGEYSMTQGEYDTQRAQIIAGLTSSRRMFA